MTHFAVSQDWLPSQKRLAQAVSGLRPGAPIVIMLHGYKYDPAHPDRSPDRHIFALHPDPGGKRPSSWPRKLGLRGPNGLAIGFGWHAAGTIWQAHRQAGRAALRLTALIRRVKAVAPNHPVHIVAHSLGARVALLSMRYLPERSINRVILIAAATFEFELKCALDSPAGQTAEVINVRSRANTVFDLLLRAALPHWGPTTGRGRFRHSRLLDINIDCRTTQGRLRQVGLDLRPDLRRVCHWSGYLRDDICAVYRRLVHRPDQTPLPHLQQIIAPEAEPMRLDEPGSVSFS